MKIQPPSAFAGAGLLALTLVAASAVQHPRRAPQEPIVEEDSALRVVGIADPRAQVVIREDEGPRKVPEGKVLVLTGLGATSHGKLCKLYVNDQLELTRAYHDHEGLSVVPVPPPGLIVRSGDVIKVRADGVGRAWGYLIDA